MYGRKRLERGCQDGCMTPSTSPSCLPLTPHLADEDGAQVLDDVLTRPLEEVQRRSRIHGYEPPGGGEGRFDAQGDGQ